MWNVGVAVRQLAAHCVLWSLDDLAKQGNWLANVPPLLAKNIAYDGHVIAVPVDVGGANYQFCGVKVFHDLNMEPPKMWDEFLGDAPKICPGLWGWAGQDLCNRLLNVGLLFGPGRPVRKIWRKRRRRCQEISSIATFI
jgi:hypothetical protein